jgi:hypothetical protein
MSAAFGLASPRLSFADILNGPTLGYRDFAIDLSEAKDAPNLEAIQASLRHQIDIVVDCGAKPPAAPVSALISRSTRRKGLSCCTSSCMPIIIACCPRALRIQTS